MYRTYRNLYRIRPSISSIGQGRQRIPLPPFLIGFAVSSLLSYQLGKMDPAGKTILVYLRDYFTYLFQSKVHDGFEKRSKVNGKRTRVFWKVPLTLMEDGRIASLPAKGKASQFELCVPASVKVKHGELTFHHRGKRIEPGYYEVNGNQLDKKQKPPSLKRVRPMIPNKQGVIKLNGTIRVPDNVSPDDFFDKLLTFIEQKGGYFIGVTNDFEDYGD